MKRLYIRFAGDNDFIRTVISFVKDLGERVFFDNWNNITKSEIVSLFNECAFAYFLINQSDKPILSQEEMSLHRSYLKIKEKDVYFDEEIDSFEDWNHDGCLIYINPDPHSCKRLSTHIM
jgi:hypothetical protein